MKNLSKLSVLLLVALFVALGAGNALGAGKYPEKPITLIVHAGAGGGSDIFARTMAAAFEKDKLLPQPLVVENKPGGSGGIAFAYVAGKKKDPYFLVTAVTSFLTTPLMGLTPVGLKDFTPIANFAFDEYMLMVNPNSKYKSVKEIIDDAKANPKKITVGGTQLGSSDSICAYLIEKAAGVQFNYIVFNGGGEVNAALLGGHIDMAVSQPRRGAGTLQGGQGQNPRRLFREAPGRRPRRPDHEGAGGQRHLRPEPRPRRPGRHPGGRPEGPGRGLRSNT